MDIPHLARETFTRLSTATAVRKSARLAEPADNVAPAA